jgi:hypothetical protein
MARANLGATLPANGVVTAGPLDVWSQDIGLAAGGRLPGLTVGPLMYRLSVRADAATQDAIITWGFIVTNEMITTAADFSPATKEHLDWMEWGQAQVTLGANTLLQLVGGGDNGFRRTATKRRVKEVEDQLVFAIISNFAGFFHLNVSTAVMLP